MLHTFFYMTQSDGGVVYLSLCFFTFCPFLVCPFLSPTHILKIPCPDHLMNKLCTCTLKVILMDILTLEPYLYLKNCSRINNAKVNIKELYLEDAFP